jgi:hypothetical protein
MYAWLWRHLPFRRWQYKLATSLVLVVGVGALLWYVVFPWAEPLLPFDDVQVTQDSGDPGAPDISVTPSAGDEHDIPYATPTGE